MSRHGDVRRRLIVAGRVQGVGFRASCSARAHALGLAGSVRNMGDGTVEVIAEGSRAAVDELTAWCRYGPPLAEVTGVTVVDQPVRGDSGFRVS